MVAPTDRATVCFTFNSGDSSLGVGCYGTGGVCFRGKGLIRCLRPITRRLAVECSGRLEFRTASLISHRTFHRLVFLTAALYNMSWGVYSAFDPQWFFRFSGLPPTNHPEIFVCLGMVIGLYGILYLDVFRAPERGWLIAAVGLAGKVIGPVGAIALIWIGRWPAKSIMLCATNDFIWWLPFTLYLFDVRKLKRTEEGKSRG